MPKLLASTDLRRWPYEDPMSRVSRPYGTCTKRGGRSLNQEPFDQLRPPLTTEQRDVRLIVFDIPGQRAAPRHVRQVSQNHVQRATQTRQQISLHQPYKPA